MAPQALLVLRLSNGNQAYINDISIATIAIQKFLEAPSFTNDTKDRPSMEVKPSKIQTLGSQCDIQHIDAQSGIQCIMPQKDTHDLGAQLRPFVLDSKTKTKKREREMATNEDSAAKRRARRSAAQPQLCRQKLPLW